jgi:hypothetical protein
LANGTYVFESGAGIQIFNTEERAKLGILLYGCRDYPNPYILYEQTRRCTAECYIPVKKVDMAVFPPDEINTVSPVPAPTALDSEK